MSFIWVCIALNVVPLLFAGDCSFPVADGFDVVIVDTDEELHYLQKYQASKTPLFIPIQSYSLALLSFTALGQQRVICYLLR